MATLHASERKWRVERLITALPGVDPEAMGQHAYDLLMSDPSAPSLAVVHDRRPIGLLSRQDILVAFSQPLVRAAYEGRTIARLMRSPYISKEYLAVEASLSIEELKEIITSRFPRAVIDGFIITRDGEYAGIGSGLSLLSLSLEQARGQIADLEDARFAAQQANQAKSTFLASISHELRTPLNAVIGFSEILQKQYYGPLNERQGEYVSDILRSGNHLLSLINDILDLSKAEAGKLELNEEEVDLNAVVHQTVRMLRPRMESKRIVTEVELPYRILRVEGDGQKLRQVLINLLANAVKFTPDGGFIRVTATVIDGAPILVVKDMGIGIVPEDIEAVLRPFERAKTQDRLAQEGTGIGLPLSKSIMELHGGSLHLSSELGLGTEVIARMPPNRLRFRSPSLQLDPEQLGFLPTPFLKSAAS